MKKVLVAMSGGVDSSCAAYLLKKKGYDVTGVTMCLGIKKANERKPTCCGAEAITDAKSVCIKLGIPHYVFDFSKHLEEKIIKRFVLEYSKGRTPNPCVDCNTFLKFDILLKKALSLGFDFLATGHYAKIVRRNGTCSLKKAKDKTKDQSYFLYSIKKDALKRILFPLGNLTKEEVRKLAKKAKLPVANKRESQNLCFIPDKNYHNFISERSKKIKHGPIVDSEGKILGEHNGALFYTVGQRGGIRIAREYPLYVLSIDTKSNKVVVGKREELKSKGLLAKEVNLLRGKHPKKVIARIRYNQGEARCKATLQNKRKTLKFIFDKKQEAVTPGQSVVLYDKDTVLGGAVIERSIR